MSTEQKPEEKKSAVQQALETQFDKLLEMINKRFAEAADQVLGLSKWIQVQLQMVQNKVRKSEISQQVIDVSNSAILELMFEKNVITKEEFEAKVQDIVKRKGLDAPKSEKA